MEYRTKNSIRQIPNTFDGKKRIKIERASEESHKTQQQQQQQPNPHTNIGIKKEKEEI